MGHQNNKNEQTSVGHFCGKLAMGADLGHVFFFLDRVFLVPLLPIDVCLCSCPFCGKSLKFYYGKCPIDGYGLPFALWHHHYRHDVVMYFSLLHW